MIHGSMGCDEVGTVWGVYMLEIHQIGKKMSSWGVEGTNNARIVHGCLRYEKSRVFVNYIKL
jgi:hypothetical protein